MAVYEEPASCRGCERKAERKAAKEFNKTVAEGGKKMKVPPEWKHGHTAGCKEGDFYGETHDFRARARVGRNEKTVIAHRKNLCYTKSLLRFLTVIDSYRPYHSPSRARAASGGAWQADRRRPRRHGCPHQVYSHTPMRSR